MQLERNKVKERFTIDIYIMVYLLAKMTFNS